MTDTVVTGVTAIVVLAFIFAIALAKAAKAGDDGD